jgi:hypothetical protein
MAYRSTRQLEEELARLEEELEAARSLERASAERHAREDMPETEAVLEARRTQVEHLGKKRDRLLEELRQRAVEEMGWAPDDDVEDPEADRASAGCGRAGRLRIGLHPLLPERGYIIYDRVDATVAWVREVPSPALAAELLAKHGVEWEGELLSHNLSPVPVEEEQRRR